MNTNNSRRESTTQTNFWKLIYGTSVSSFPKMHLQIEFTRPKNLDVYERNFSKNLRRKIHLWVSQCLAKTKIKTCWIWYAKISKAVCWFDRNQFSTFFNKIDVQNLHWEYELHFHSSLNTKHRRDLTTVFQKLTYSVVISQPFVPMFFIYVSSHSWYLLWQNLLLQFTHVERYLTKFGVAQFFDESGIVLL